MQISLEVSLYPFEKDVVPPVLQFIETLNSHEDVEVVTNSMSTQIYGDLGLVMKALHSAIEKQYNNGGKAAVVVKIIPGDARQYAEK